MKTSRITCLALAAAGAICMASRAAAFEMITNRWENISALGTATNRWESSLAAGLTLTKGNSDKVQGSIGIRSTRRSPLNEVLLGAFGTYGETTIERTRVTSSGARVTEEETTTTASAVGGYGQYNHLLTEKLYGGARADVLHDDLADLKYRVTLSPLAGWYAVKQPTMKLNLELGPSGVFEEQGGEVNDYAAVRLGDRFERKLTARARVWQSFDVIPQLDRLSNYLLIAEVGAEAALNGRFTVRSVLQDTYDNEPAEGRSPNDIRLITSLVYKF